MRRAATRLVLAILVLNVLGFVLVQAWRWHVMRVLQAPAARELTGLEIAVGTMAVGWARWGVIGSAAAAIGILAWGFLTRRADRAPPRE